MFRGKAVVIGAGFVGSTTAYTLMCGGLFKEIVIIDINRNKAEGDAMDIAHGVSFVRPVDVYCGSYSDCHDADIIIITAGANQKPDETRLELLKKNSSIIRDVVENIMKYAPDDIILLTVSNPVDILSYITYKISGLPSNRVIGSGTVLDTSRLKYMLSHHTCIDARNCHTYIIGEHGDSEVAAWSITNIAGMSLQEIRDTNGKCSLLDLENMYSKVVNAAYEIIRKKGATYYAIALAIERIVECIAGEENSFLTVSSVLNGQYGIKDVSLSVPTQLSGNGVEWIPEVSFSEDEIAGLHRSAEIMRAYLTELGF